jgi:hypothetical protein
MKKTIQITAGIFLLAWLVTTCTAQIPPPAVATPTCFPRPEATGEKVIGPTVEATPPTQVSPGQTITIILSGDYIIGNNAIVCGDEVLRHAYSDALPSFSWQRTVEVLLDEQVLATVECEYTCQIEATIPQNILPGPHQLILDTIWESIIFELQVR